MSFLSKGLSGVFSSTTVWRYHSSKGSILPSLWFSSHNHMWLLGKTIALTVWTFVGRVLCLLLNTLSRFVIPFLWRSSHLISCVQLPSSVILEPEKWKSVTTSNFFPFYLLCSNGAGCHDLSFFFFLIFSLKPPLSLFSFTLIKSLFSSSSLSAIRVVSSSYLRLLMFLPPILIPACTSFSPAQHFSWCIACLAYKQTGWQQTALSYSFLNPEPNIWSIQGSDCHFLTHKQVSQETGKMVWYSH